MGERYLIDTSAAIKYLTTYFPSLKYENVWLNYNDRANVLYVHFKKPNHVDRLEIAEDGIIVRYGIMKLLDCLF